MARRPDCAPITVFSGAVSHPPRQAAPCLPMTEGVCPKQVERLAKFMQQSERLKEFDFSVLRECARSEPAVAFLARCSRRPRCHQALRP